MTAPPTGPAADPHVVASEALPNLRDLGGRPTGDGRTVRPGLVYRSAELFRPAVRTDPPVAALALRTVVDLRTERERTSRPDTLPNGARLVELDVLADLPAAAAAHVDRMMTSPGDLVAVLDQMGVGAGEALKEAYRSMVGSPSARRSYRALLLGLLDAANRPLLFHCTAGKDRTGWAAAVLLHVAGVDDDGVMAEFLAVNPALRTMFEPLVERFAAAGGDAVLLRPLLEVRAEYLAAALTAVQERYGGFDGYLTDGLGLQTAQVDGLRGILTD